MTVLVSAGLLGCGCYFVGLGISTELSELVMMVVTVERKKEQKQAVPSEAPVPERRLGSL